jgi:hypothetical protein
MRDDYTTREGVAAMSHLDAQGVLRWNTNNAVPFRDVCTIYFGNDVAAINRCQAARDADTAAFCAEYRRNYNKGPSAEERAEARAAHGEGVELVNVITGTKFRT